MLEPAYVTNGSLVPNAPQTPNIGICKNGFGGFAIGILVFRTDDDAEAFRREWHGRCERVAPGVYLCWHST